MGTSSLLYMFYGKHIYLALHHTLSNRLTRVYTDTASVEVIRVTTTKTITLHDIDF
jgi:hypothetical protein